MNAIMAAATLHVTPQNVLVLTTALTPAKLTPRKYQVDALCSVWDALHGEGGNVLAVLPTGCGKAYCIAEMVAGWLEEYPTARVLVLTHSRELVRQNYLEMLRLWPECPAGIYSAGLNRRDIGAQVVFGGIQSLFRRGVELGQVDLILVDEAQSIPRSANGMWGMFLAEVRKGNPDLRIVGWTATAFRMDSGMLHEGEGAIFSRIAYEYPISAAIADGFLCEPVSVSSTTQIDTSSVGTRGGEFIAGELEDAAMDRHTVNGIADALLEHGADRIGWIVFGCGIAHCAALRDALRVRGVSCEGVFADTPGKERDAHIEAFKARRLRALVSVNALTTGFNVPHVDLVALARPTKSAGLYIQAIGRGTRLSPGKQNVLVVDFGANLKRFGPIDAVKVRTSAAKDDEDNEAPVKACPECEAENPISARVCGECGAEFEGRVSLITTKAASAAVLTSQVRAEWVPVSGVHYTRHTKEGKPDSLAVIYQCGLVQHREWACLEHTGYARQKAVDFWRQRAPGTVVPNTVAEALERVGDLRRPTAISVQPHGKYVEISGVRF